MLNKSQYYQNSPDNAHALSYPVCCPWKSYFWNQPMFKVPYLYLQHFAIFLIGRFKIKKSDKNV